MKYLEKTMSERYPLTIYYDGSCSLCNNEMQSVRLHDSQQRLLLLDCSTAEFDDAPFLPEGITRSQMMERLHCRDNCGKWFKGVDAFELIYQSIGMPAVAALWGGKFTRPLMERVYPWVARHRRLMSLSGLPLLFKWWGKRAALRANEKSRRCHDGQCSI